MSHEHFLTQFISEPTHCRGNQSPTLIDLLISNDEKIVQNVCHSPPFGLSHHDTITFQIAINQTKINLPPKLVYLMDKGDYPAMKSYLKSVDWDEKLNNVVDVDVMWNLIENEIDKAKSKYIPTKTIKKCNIDYKPKFPIPSNLLELIHDKRSAYKYFRQYPTNHNKEIYHLLRNKVNVEVRKAKVEKEVNIAKKSKHNPKILYQYISSQSKPREHVANLKREDGSVTENDSEKANVLNEFFSSVFVEEGDSPSPPFNANFNDVLNNILITTTEMEKKLKALKVNKSPGPDGMHPRLLSECAEEIAVPFKILFDLTMKMGKLPAKWKLAEVKPLFKKGCKSQPGNYRPVSLTSIVCKVFESFVRDSINSHIVTNNLLSPNQFGFCKGRSCVTQLLKILNTWFYYLDQNIPVDSIYLDFQKAFDSVPHKRLIEKLRGNGIRGNVLNWISDFLSSRTQYVTVNGYQSRSVPVTSGVPQGSVLGPSLFIYYINDLPKLCEALCEIFADDAKVFNSIKSSSDCCLIQRTLDALSAWSDKWLLSFNAAKCNVLHLGKNNIKHDYYMIKGDNKIILNKTECEKDLGVYIDKNLDFKKHISTQIKKARSTSGIIYRNIINKKANIMVPLFKSMIRPIVEYGNVVWAPHLKKDIIAIESIQRNYTKKIKGMRNKSYEERLAILRLPSLSYRRLRGDLIEVFKIVNNVYDPVTTNTLLTRVPKTTVTRKNNLSKIRTNKNPYKYFFTNRVNNIWNQLPNHIVDAKNINIFKNKIDSHFRDLKYTVVGI